MSENALLHNHKANLPYKPGPVNLWLKRPCNKIENIRSPASQAAEGSLQGCLYKKGYAVQWNAIKGGARKKRGAADNQTTPELILCQKMHKCPLQVLCMLEAAKTLRALPLLVPCKLFRFSAVMLR
jgi:hypothetical protein